MTRILHRKKRRPSQRRDKFKNSTKHDKCSNNAQTKAEEVKTQGFGMKRTWK
jgi:hypothetical protein